MICVACGMQSQEFIPESFETDDNFELMKVSGRMRGKYRPVVKGPPKIKQVTPDAETVDFLVAYQFCLQLLTNSVVAAAIQRFPAHSSFDKDVEYYTEADNNASVNSTNNNNSSSSSSSALNGKNARNKSETRRSSRNILSNSKHIESLSVVVKELWDGYMSAWSLSGCNITAIFDNKGIEDPDPDKADASELNRHPLYPSKPLMLGKHDRKELMIYREY